MTVASASVRPMSPGSSTVHAASATTGSVPHSMGKHAMVGTMMCVVKHHTDDEMMILSNVHGHVFSILNNADSLNMAIYINTIIFCPEFCPDLITAAMLASGV